jgi:uncharacterized protein YicC (UPF0701 family)
MLMHELSQDDLLTALRSIARVTGCRELVVGGRGALVVSSASAALRATQDFDIGITLEGTGRGMTTLDGELGKASAFAAEHGFYVEHAGAEMLTFVLPSGWQMRVTRIETEDLVALCLAPVDVAINKLHAKRPKDIEHLATMLNERVVTVEELETAINASPYPFMMESHRKVLSQVLLRLHV